MSQNAPTLIPREALFGNPEREHVTISRDGMRIGFLAPLDGVMNVWVAPASDPNAARAVTSDAKRGIRFYVWTHNAEYLLYIQDSEGDEDWHIYAVNVETGETRDLTPFEGVHAMILELSPRFPDEALVSLNARDARYHDVHRVNILTGETSLVHQNDIGAFEFVADDEFKVRLAMITSDDGGTSLLERSGGEWLPFAEIGLEDGLTTYPLGFDSDGETLYVADSRGRDTSALAAYDFGDRSERALAFDERADASEFIVHPATGRVQAVSFEYERTRWQVVDDAIAADLDRIRAAAPGDFHVASRSYDDSRWIVAYARDDGPVAFHLYDRKSGEMQYLFTNRPALEKYDLRPMESAVVKSRDGLDMVLYYTLPQDATESADGDSAPSRPLPTVLNVHGGPWWRDSWGYDPEHQLLANRGYAVISVNFRGSTGFGKRFVNAGDREWGGKMHDDLIDVVNWAVESGIADPERVAIMGGSYGGYATLVGMTFTPETFACGVDIVGPSSLITALETIPAYWEPMAEMEKARIGDLSTDEGRRFLESRSPLNRVDAIVKPLLIAQGANDPRVKRAESDQIVAAMAERGIPVTYALFGDEGHGFARPENRLAFMAVAEAFLSRHLGGAHQPIGDDFYGSSIEILAGVDGVPGLAERV